MFSRLLIWISLLLAFSSSFASAGDPTPKVVAIWPSGPLEVRLEFDRPADPALAAQLVGTKISFGDSVKPGEPAKTSPLTDPTDPSRGSIRITGATLVDEGRTLVLATDPHPLDTRYTFTLPTLPKPVNLVYDLSGVELAWDDGQPGALPTWRGWWPSLDSESANARLSGSEAQVTLVNLLTKPGRLTLRTLATLPKGKAVVTLSASSPFEATLFTESAKSKADSEGVHKAELSAESTGEPLDLSVVIATGGKSPLRLIASSKPSPAAGRAFTLPFAPARPPVSPSTPFAEALYQGGNPKKGETLFASETAKCATCHKFRGKGGAVGPALDDVPGRDRAWIYRQIAEPSATIHPEYLPYTVVFKDGRIAAGVVRAEGLDKIAVVDTEAKSLVFPKSEIEEMRPSNTSIMPVGLVGAIGEEGLRDLIAYLSTPVRP